MRTAIGIVALSVFLAGCAPSALRVKGPLSPVTPAEASTEPRTGDQVRWGGAIVATVPMQSETCFDVISKPLDSSCRPRGTDETLGRFRACAPGFYDPGIYEGGRLITVVGTLRGTVSGQIGEYTLPYPLVAAETVYLWRRKDPRAYDPYPARWFGYPFSYWAVRHRTRRGH